MDDVNEMLSMVTLTFSERSNYLLVDHLLNLYRDSGMCNYECGVLNPQPEKGCAFTINDITEQDFKVLLSDIRAEGVTDFSWRYETTEQRMLPGPEKQRF